MCGIKELEIGEIVLFKYTNGGWETVIIDRIDNNTVYFHENHHSEEKFFAYGEHGCIPSIQKIFTKKEWDNEENKSSICALHTTNE